MPAEMYMVDACFTLPPSCRDFCLRNATFSLCQEYEMTLSYERLTNIWHFESFISYLSWPCLPRCRLINSKKTKPLLLQFWPSPNSVHFFQSVVLHALSLILLLNNCSVYFCVLLRYLIFSILFLSQIQHSAKPKDFIYFIFLFL